MFVFPEKEQEEVEVEATEEVEGELSEEEEGRRGYLLFWKELPYTFMMYKKQNVSTVEQSLFDWSEQTQVQAALIANVKLIH